MTRRRLIKPEHEKFCIAYTTPGEFAGNAYKAYAYAYDIEIPKREDGKYDSKSKEYQKAQSSGSRLLLHPDVQDRMKELYLEYMNDRNVDARLGEIVRRGRDTDSIQAIKIYNDLKGRITKKMDVTTGGRPFASLSDDELKAMLEQE